MRSVMTIIALTSALVCANAMAQGSAPAPTPPPDLEEGRRHHLAGVAAASGGDFVVAEREFRAALDIAFRPSSAYNLAVALEHNGRFTEAIELYERLRALPAAQLPAPNTPETLEEDRRRAIAQQATLRVTVGGAPQATVTLDGTPAGTFMTGTAIALPVDPGAHILAGSAGERRTEVSVNLEPGEQRDVQLSFAPRPEQVAATATTTTTTTTDVDVMETETPQGTREEPPRRRSAVIYWVIGGVLVAGAAVALGLAFRPSTPAEDSVIPTWTALRRGP